METASVERFNKKRKLDEDSIQWIETNDCKKEDKKMKKQQSNVIKKVKERQRRSRITESISELKKLVPACSKERKINQTLIMSLSVDYIRFLHKKIEALESENEMLRNGHYDGSRIPELPKEPDFSFTEYQQQKDKELEEKTQLLTTESISIKEEKMIQHSKFLNEQALLENDYPEIIFDHQSQRMHCEKPQHIEKVQRMDSRIGYIPMSQMDYQSQLRRPFKYTEHPQMPKPLNDFNDIEEVGNWPVNYTPPSYAPPKIQNVIPQYMSYPHPPMGVSHNPYMNNIPESFSYRKPIQNIGQDVYYYNNSLPLL